MKSRDIKKIAKTALKGNWFVAVIASIIASFFGVGGSSFSISIPAVDPATTEETTTVLANVTSQSTQLTPEGVMILTIIYAAFVLFALIVTLIISSIIRVGYAQFNLDIIDGSDARIGTLFSRTKQMGVTIRTTLLMIIRLVFGYMLIIPGIVMTYSYAMADYVLADNPEMNARQALKESRRIMRGNRFKLFCLSLSFIGLTLLCILTLGIGFIWLNPYMQASFAAFYREAKKNAR